MVASVNNNVMRSLPNYLKKQLYSTRYLLSNTVGSFVRHGTVSVKALFIVVMAHVKEVRPGWVRHYVASRKSL